MIRVAESSFKVRGTPRLGAKYCLIDHARDRVLTRSCHVAAAALSFDAHRDQVATSEQHAHLRRRD